AVAHCTTVATPLSHLPRPQCPPPATAGRYLWPQHASVRAHWPAEAPGGNRAISPAVRQGHGVGTAAGATMQQGWALVVTWNSVRGPPAEPTSCPSQHEYKRAFYLLST